MEQNISQVFVWLPQLVVMKAVVVVVSLNWKRTRTTNQTCFLFSQRYKWNIRKLLASCLLGKTKAEQCQMSPEKSVLLLLSFSPFTYQRQDSWSIYLSDSLHRPIHAVPCRQNVCKFHRFLTPRQGFHAPSRKIDAKALMRYFSQD